MKKLILLAAMVSFAGVVAAEQVNVERKELGSGQPGEVGVEESVVWNGDIHHATQYMPGQPTAATLYPRVVDVPCTQEGDVLTCKGYNWMPEMGRGEYLMIRPVVAGAPVVQTNTVYVEVPVKRKSE